MFHICLVVCVLVFVSDPFACEHEEVPGGVFGGSCLQVLPAARVAKVCLLAVSEAGKRSQVCGFQFEKTLTSLWAMHGEE